MVDQLYGGAAGNGGQRVGSSFRLASADVAGVGDGSLIAARSPFQPVERSNLTLP